MKKYISDALHLAALVLLLWVVISNITQAIKCPKMSQTELLMHIPKSFVRDYQHCN